MSNIAHKFSEYKFNRADWPINPTTGQRFTRDEIVTNPQIPYPQGVDTSSDYWRRRTPDELAAEKAKISKKSKRRQARRKSRRSSRRSLTSSVPLSGAEIQTRQHAEATQELVERKNRKGEVEASTRSILVTGGRQFLVMEV